MDNKYEEMRTDAVQSSEAPPGRARPDRLTISAFAVFVVLVAANVVAIRFTNRGLPPFWGAGTRFAIASILFFLYVIIRRLSLPRGRALAGTLLFGVLQFGVGFALGYWALLEVPAGLASVILASVPLFTLLFAFAARLEPLRFRGVVGALVAIGGIALIYGERAGKDIPTPYLLAAVGTAACFALAPVIVKSFPPVHPATMNALGMITGALILLSLSFASNEAGVIPGDSATWAAYLYLILLGSVGVFALYLFVLRRWTASGVSYQAVLSPLVAIALSAWLLDEPLTGGLFLGGTLVMAGVYVGALAPRRHTA
jgi:drug/metabolite transporter (DMT)-like permease